ncbi:MAG: hypothetical protein LBI69_03580 [Puniceicoccales bacterium]|jgi:hypothetical protein|nr:hypothetical protein [Puniceicoccales bacterium]
MRVLRPSPVNSQGFALLLILGLLAILGVVVLSTERYVQIQARRGRHRMHQSIAQWNARSALRVAMDELDEIYRDGRCITGRANLRLNPVSAEHSEWVGVWDVVDEKLKFNRWLVSADAATKRDFMAPESVCDKESTIAIFDDFGLQDRCPRMAIQCDGKIVGHYAYWIEDECSKIRINLPMPTLPTDRIAQQFHGIGIGDSSLGDGRREFLEKQCTFRALREELGSGVDRYFHGITLCGCGLLRNTSGEWLIDLTAKLRGHQYAPVEYLFSGNQEWPEPPPTFALIGSFFDATRRATVRGIFPVTGGPHYVCNGLAANVYSQTLSQLPVPDLGLNIPVQSGIHPVLVGLSISLIAQGDHGHVTLTLQPKVFLWNPYAKELNGGSYIFRIVPASTKKLPPGCFLGGPSEGVSFENIFAQWPISSSFQSGEVQAFTIEGEGLSKRISLNLPEGTPSITLSRMNTINFSWSYLTLQLLDGCENLLQEISDFIDGDSGKEYDIVLDGTAREIFRLIAVAQTGSGGDGSIQWIAHHNPRAPQIRRSTYENAPLLGVKDHFFRHFIPWNVAFVDAVPGGVSIPPTEITFWGDGNPSAVLFDLPDEAYSIATLQHVPLTPFSYHPAYAVGNSLSNPLIPANAVGHHAMPSIEAFRNHPFFRQSMLFDYSYLLNAALYDHYFVSGFREVSNGISYFFTTCSLDQYDTGGDADLIAPLDDCMQSGRHMVRHGAFNVNSTSCYAWQCMLRSMPSDRLGNSYFIPRFFDQQSSGENFQIHHSLREEDLNRLSECIVEEIKRCGPFATLGAFINRDPLAKDRDAMECGPIQRAINRAGVNDSLDQLSPKSRDTRDPSWFNEDVANGATNFQSPAYLSQADFLQFFGNQFTVRSDTFFIRTYGDSADAMNGKICASAMCEATVQMTPSGKWVILSLVD